MVSIVTGQEEEEWALTLTWTDGRLQCRLISDWETLFMSVPWWLFTETCSHRMFPWDSSYMTGMVAKATHPLQSGLSSLLTLRAIELENHLFFNYVLSPGRVIWCRDLITRVPGYSLFSVPGCYQD